MKEKVFNIISNVMNLPLKNIKENSSSDNIDTWDSLNQMNLILALEEEFDLEFTDEQIVEMTTVRSIIENLESLVK